MASATSASASAQFFPASSVCQAENSWIRDSMRSPTRWTSSARSSAPRADHAGKAVQAASRAATACSGDASEAVPMIRSGCEGSTLSTVRLVSIRSPPISRGAWTPIAPGYQGERLLIASLRPGLGEIRIGDGTIRLQHKASVCRFVTGYIRQHPSSAHRSEPIWAG